MIDKEKSIDYCSPIEEDFHDPNWDDGVIEQEKLVRPEFILVEGNNKLDSFYVSNIPVTQELYQKVMNNNPSNNINDKNPVEMISWIDAILFCNKISLLKQFSPYYLIDSSGNVSFCKSSKGYRLPTKKEWIFAAVGGNRKEQYLFSGNNNLSEVGWFTGNSLLKTHACGQKKSNSIDLYDMSGNIWEWTSDGKDHENFVCGGCAKSKSEDCEILKQGNFAFPSVARDPFIGFRLVRSY